MQAAVPELCEIEGETDATKKLYGLDSQIVKKQVMQNSAFWHEDWWKEVFDLLS
jgi:hypothetical protein